MLFLFWGWAMILGCAWGSTSVISKDLFQSCNNHLQNPQVGSSCSTSLKLMRTWNPYELPPLAVALHFSQVNWISHFVAIFDLKLIIAILVSNLIQGTLRMFLQQFLNFRAQDTLLV